MIAAVFLTLGVTLPVVVGALWWRSASTRSFAEQIGSTTQVRLALVSLSLYLGMAALALLTGLSGPARLVLPVLAAAATLLGHGEYMFLVTSEEAARRAKLVGDGVFESWRERVQWHARRVPGTTSLLALSMGVLFSALGIYIWRETSPIDDPSERGLLTMFAAVAVAGFAMAAYHWLASASRADFWMWRDMTRLAWRWNPTRIETRMARYVDSVLAWAQESPI